MMSGLHELIHRQRPGPWQKFWSQPFVYLARTLYDWHKPLIAMPLREPVEIVCISDTHNAQPLIPDGDILIHAGDLTQSGSFEEIQTTLNWLRSLSHPVKIVVAGNHDLLLHSMPDRPRQSAFQRAQLEWGDIIYLENNEITVSCPGTSRQLRIFGSPYSLKHGNWAFQYPRNQDVWTSLVPEGIDVLITHGPPLAHLDLQWGCPYLLQTLWRVRPKLHVFGHIHEGSGTDALSFNRLQKAYERTIASNGDCKSLLLTAWELAKACLRPAVEAKCLLVNPSILGGLRDDERRQPIKVVI